MKQQLIGQLSYQQKYQLHSGEHTISIDVSDLVKGTYFVQVLNEGKSGIQKIIIP
jgi:hypothetical protein